MKNKINADKDKIVDVTIGIITDEEKRALEKEFEDQKSFEIIATKGMC